MAQVVRTPFVERDLVLISLPADAAARVYHLEPCIVVGNPQVYAFAAVETRNIWIIKQSTASDPHTRDRPGQVRAFALSSIEGEVRQDDLDHSAPNVGVIRSSSSRLTRICFSIRHSNSIREDVILLSTERDTQLSRFIASALRSWRTNSLLGLTPAPSDYPPKPEQATRLVRRTLDAVRAAIPGMSLRGVSSTSAHGVLASEAGGGHAAARLRSSMRALREAGAHANPRDSAPEIAVTEHISRSVDPGDYSLELLMTAIAAGRVAVKTMDRLGTPLAKHRAITAAFFASDLPITLISLLLTCADTFDTVVELMRSPVIRSMRTCHYDGRIVLELQVVRLAVLRAGAALLHAALHDSAGIPQRSMLANPLPFGLTVLCDVLIRGFRHGLQPELYMHGTLVLDNGKAEEEDNGLRVRVVRPYRVLHAIPLRAGTRADGYNFGSADDADGEGENYLIGRGLGITVSRLKQGTSSQTGDVNMQATFQAALRKARREQAKKAGHRDAEGVCAGVSGEREADLERSIRSRRGVDADPTTRRAVSGIASDLYGLSTPEPFNYSRVDDSSVDIHAAVESAYYTARTERVSEARQRMKDREVALVRAKEVAEARQRQAEIRAGARRGWGLLRSRWDAAGLSRDAEDEGAVDGAQEELASSDEEGEPIVIPELSFKRPASPEMVGSRSAGPGARHLIPDEAVMPLARTGTGSPGKGAQALAESSSSLEDASALFRTVVHVGGVNGNHAVPQLGQSYAFNASNRSHPYARYRDSDAVHDASGPLLSRSAMGGGGLQASILRSSMGMSRSVPSASASVLPIPASPMPQEYTRDAHAKVKVLPLQDHQLQQARQEQEQGGDLMAVLSASMRSSAQQEQQRGGTGASSSPPSRRGHAQSAQQSSSPSSPMRFTDLCILTSESTGVVAVQGEELVVAPEPLLLELLCYAAEEARDYRDVATVLLAELDDVVATSHIALLPPGERMRVTAGSGLGAHGMMDDLRFRNTTAGSIASLHSYASNRGKVIAAELISYQSDLADPVVNRHHYKAIHKHLPGVRDGGALHAKRLLSSAVMHGPGLGGPLGQGAIPDQQDEGWWYGPYGEDAMQGGDGDGDGQGVSGSTYSGAVAGSDRGHSMITDVEGRKLRAGIANIGSEPAKSIAEALSRLPTLEAVSFLADQGKALDTLLRIAIQARKAWDATVRTIVSQGSEDDLVLLASSLGFPPRQAPAGSAVDAGTIGGGTPHPTRGVGGYTGLAQDRPHIAAMTGAAGAGAAGSAAFLATTSAASSLHSAPGSVSSAAGAAGTGLHLPLPSAFSSGSGRDRSAATASTANESFSVGRAAVPGPADSSSGTASSVPTHHAVRAQDGHAHSQRGLSNVMLVRSGYLPRASPSGPVAVRTGPTLTESLRSILRLGGPQSSTRQGSKPGVQALPTPGPTPAPVLATAAQPPMHIPPLAPASGSQSRYTGPTAAQLSAATPATPAAPLPAPGQEDGASHRREEEALTAAMLDRPMDEDLTEDGMAALAYLLAYLQACFGGGQGVYVDSYEADPLPLLLSASSLGAQLTDDDVTVTAQYRDPLFAVRINTYARLLLSCVRDSPSLRTACVRSMRAHLPVLTQLHALDGAVQGRQEAIDGGTASVASLASTRLAQTGGEFDSVRSVLHHGHTGGPVGVGQGSGLQHIFHVRSEPLFAEAATVLHMLRTMLGPLERS